MNWSSRTLRVLPNTTPRGRLARLTLLTWALAALAVSALLVAGALTLSLVSAGTVVDVWTFDVTSRVPAVCALAGLVLLAAAATVALVTDELRAGIAVLAGRDTLTQDPVTVHAHHLLTDRRTASPLPAHRILLGGLARPRAPADDGSLFGPAPVPAATSRAEHPGCAAPRPRRLHTRPRGPR